ncbi:MAG: UDP-galactopyranose mutase [Terracidiphilus sp.]
MSPKPANQDVLVVGAGFAGAVAAERLASAGREVLVIDRRDHIAGNAYDHLDSHGILVHRFGPHLFHTNSDAVFEYLSRFTEWRPYEHRVLVSLEGRLYPLPINQETINQLYGLNLDEAGVERFLAGVRERREPVMTSEDVVLNAVGRELCEKIFRGYTRKQWSLDLAELSPSVLARIPTRTNRDDRYFTDKHQAMPAEGFARMFEKMLRHPRICVETGAEFADIRERVRPQLTVFTGCIDEYFGYRLGRLPYRSIRFVHEHLAGVERFQPVATINYPNENEYTRITEFKHITGQQHSGTSIVKEFPTDEGEPYYPVPRPVNQELYRRYQELAASEKNVVFLGRLAQYRYYNMDQAAAAALKAAAEIVGG